MAKKDSAPGVQVPGLVMEQVGEVAVVATVPDPDGVRVVCTVDLRSPRAPRVVEVTITGRPLDRKGLRSMIPALGAVESLPTIKVGTLRGFTISEFEDAARAEGDEYQAMLADMVGLLAWCKATGFGSQLLLSEEYQFRTWRDKSAAIRKAVASWYWSYEAHSIEQLAESFDITPTAAKQLVAQARKAGFLLPGTPGKAGAGISKEGWTFLGTVLEAWKKHEGALV